jgi:hypothetical protein
MFVQAKVHLSFSISNGILLLIVKSKTGSCCKQNKNKQKTKNKQSQKKKQ